MPAYILPFRCDGCGECVKVCPQGILHIDPKTRKSYNIETDMCWECYPCVKACPQDAIEIRGYSDFVPLGAKVLCKRDTKANTITWTIYYRNGKLLTFAFPIRTTLWGSITPPNGLRVPPPQELKSHLLVREPEIFGSTELSTIKER